MSTPHKQTKTMLGSMSSLIAGLSSGVAGVTWGGIHAPAAAVAGWRLTFGAIIFIVLVGVRRQFRWWNKNEFFWISAACASFVLELIILVAAAQRTTIITYMIMGSAAPAVVTVAERFLFKRKLSRVSIVCITTACLGSALGILGVHHGDTTGFGNFLAVCELFTSSIYILIASRAIKRVPVDRYLLGVNGFGALALLPFMVVTGTHSFSAGEFGAIATAALFGGLISWGTFLIAQHYISAGVNTAVGLIGVPISGFLAWIFLHQLPSTAQIVSAAIVIPTIIWLIRITARGESEKQDPAFEDLPEPAF